MKRDWETIREILYKVEECTLPAESIHLGSFPKERAAEISYHMGLLIEAGLVSGNMSQSIGPEVKNFIAHRLTWSGHEFIDAIRSDTVWNKTKKIFFENGVSMTFDLIKDAAKAAAIGLMNLATAG